jgi:hypothetical protein
VIVWSNGDGGERFGELGGGGDTVAEGRRGEGWVLDGRFGAELADVVRRGFGEAEPWWTETARTSQRGSCVKVRRRIEQRLTVFFSGRKAGHLSSELGDLCDVSQTSETRECDFPGQEEEL